MSVYVPEEEVWFMRTIMLERYNRTFSLPQKDEKEINNLYYMLAIFFFYLLIIAFLVVKFAHRERITKHLDEKFLSDKILSHYNNNDAIPDDNTESSREELFRVQSCPSVGYTALEELVNPEQTLTSIDSTNDQTGDYLNVTESSIPIETLSYAVDKKWNSLPKDFVLDPDSFSVEMEFTSSIDDSEESHSSNDKPPWILPIKYPQKLDLRCLQKIRWV